MSPAQQYPKDGLLDLVLHLKYPDGVAPAKELTEFLNAWKQAAALNITEPDE